MPVTPQRTANSWLPLFIAVCLVAVNLRMSITGVGPLLDDIGADQAVSPAVLGTLAALPLLAWSLMSPLAQGLADRLGLDSAVSWSLVALILATIWRSTPGSSINLWFGTVLIGAALAVANVLLPAIIKRDFGTRVPLVMGVYSALIGVSGMLGAAIVAPVSQAQVEPGEPLGWRVALLVTGVTAPIALIVWASVTRNRRQPRSSSHGVVRAASSLTRRVWGDGVSWLIAIYMGSQSWVFYIHATWLSPIDVSRGADLVTAGFHVTYFHLFGITGSLLTPLLTRARMAKIMPLVVPAMSIVAASGIVLAPAALLLWLPIAGFACGLSLSLALLFVAQRSADIATAGAVSGMSQSFGYALAAVGPILFGWLYGQTGSWELPLAALVFGATLQLGAGIALLRGRMALANA